MLKHWSGKEGWSLTMLDGNIRNIQRFASRSGHELLIVPGLVSLEAESCANFVEFRLRLDLKQAG